eukprot:6191467-Pleurochrysis_carterae.AAC.2
MSNSACCEKVARSLELWCAFEGRFQHRTPDMAGVSVEPWLRANAREREAEAGSAYKPARELNYLE